jgi:hypothetical protein
VGIINSLLQGLKNVQEMSVTEGKNVNEKQINVSSNKKIQLRKEERKTKRKIETRRMTK